MDKALIPLVEVMSDLYPDIDSSIPFMAVIGMQSGRIRTEASPVNRWFAIIRECEKAGLIPDLIDLALVDYPANKELLAIQAANPIFPGVPLLIAAIGLDAALSLDLAALRAVRTSTGMEFARIQDATLTKLKAALDRERSHGRKVNVHLAVHSGTAGVELGGQVVDAVALSEFLDGAQVLLIAGCESSQVGDFLGVVPFVISMSEKVSHTDAAMFTQAFWQAIGKGMEPAPALRYALAHSPSGMSEYVSKSW